MDINMSLNGWQRLWVVVGILYLIPVSYMIFVTQPSNKIYQEWICHLSAYSGEDIGKPLQDVDENTITAFEKLPVIKFQQNLRVPDPACFSQYSRDESDKCDGLKNIFCITIYPLLIMASIRLISDMVLLKSGGSPKNISTIFALSRFSDSIKTSFGYNRILPIFASL